MSNLPLPRQLKNASGVILPALLIAVGAALFGLAGYSHFQPPVFPYETKLSDASSEAFSGATGSAANLGKVEQLELRAPGQRDPIANILIGREANGRVVPLNWQNNVTEPVLAADLSSAEVAKVTAAIKEHVPSDAVVLSWWDLSRKIRLVSERQAPLDDPLARGLLLPAAWGAAEAMIKDRERAFWGAGVPATDADVFAKFIAALLLDEEHGADALASLAPGKTVFVAVHLSDIWKIAAEHPDRISIAYRDFPGSGSHGVMKAARQWMAEQKILGGFAVELVGNAVRLHYLPKADEENLLITKMLPFSTSNPMRLTQLKLVYQHRGFWIYKLTPAKA